MSYQERKSIMKLVMSIIVFTGYGWYVYGKYQAAGDVANDPAFWAKYMLIMIPVSLVSMIVAMIVFAIFHHILTGEDMPKFEDERDKLIELKSMRNSMWIFILGFFVAMWMLLKGHDLQVMFIIMACAGLTSDIVSHLSKLYFYGRGV